MIVVSDNSALSALAEIGQLSLLPLLFGEVTIPEAVLRECLDSTRIARLGGRSAQHRGDSWLILDEKRGRRVAEALGLPKTGVLGIIGHAASRHLLDFDASIDALRSTGFHLSNELIEAVRRRLS